MIRAHSFDVFDTLIVRTVARPVDVLRAAAERAVPGPVDRPGRAELTGEVTRRRRAAEFQAMERLGVEAVPLDAIYEELEDLSALGVDPAALKTAELTVETEELRAVLPGIERVEAARAKGRRVLFVSDMYLPTAHIQDALERFGISRPGDPLYVSGDVGVSKRSGLLFDHILGREGLEASELVHTGDDPITDLSSPAARGVSVEPFTDARLNRYEHEMLDRLTAQRPVVARLAGASRVARLGQSGANTRDSFAAAVAADVVGPLFVGFVNWVLQTAQQEGIERLYFVSRDAQILLSLAERLAGPDGPECRYLYGSRQAWLLPGISDVQRSSLTWILQPEWALRTPRALLAKLDVLPEEVAGELQRQDLTADQALTGDALDRFWRLIDDLAPLIADRAGGRRRLVADYFEQEGMVDGTRWALVDLGWRLTAQRAVRTILGDSGPPEDVLGLYLGVSRRRTPAQEAGPFRAFILEDDEPDAGFLPEAWLWNNTILVEHAFSLADHGSCQGYRRTEEGVEPVLRDVRSDPALDSFREAERAALHRYLDEIRVSGLLDDHADELRNTGLLNGRLMLERPDRRDAAGLGWIPVADDQNESRIKELAAPLGLTDVAMSVKDALRGGVLRDFEEVNRWREGSLALTPPVTRSLFYSLRRAQRAARGLKRLRFTRDS